MNVGTTGKFSVSPRLTEFVGQKLKSRMTDLTKDSRDFLLEFNSQDCENILDEELPEGRTRDEEKDLELVSPAVVP